MTGFDKDWLALREPADRRARDARLLQSAADLIEHPADPHILDIGCGTGSTYRAFEEQLGATIRWSLFDHDETLLAEAEQRHGSQGITVIRGDLNDLSVLPVDGVSLVTASALFDLCSPAFIDRFVRRLKEAGAGLYAALNYDGVMAWTVSHPLDEVVTTVFNEHQKTDKGFGVSAGPDAWTLLSNGLQAQGYQVTTAPSPWLMDVPDAALQHLFLRGVVEAVADRGTIAESELQAWHQFRLDAIGGEGSLCRVGHQDVLAFL